MIRVSFRAAISFIARIDCKGEDEAIKAVKERMDAAARQVALDLRRAGYVVDVGVDGVCIASEEAPI